MPWVALLCGIGFFLLMTMTHPGMWSRRGLKIFLYFSWYWTLLVLGVMYVF